MFCPGIGDLFASEKLRGLCFTGNSLGRLISRRKGVSTNDLIVQGIESVLAEELDRKMVLLSDKPFEEALDFIENPTPPDVQERLRKTLSTPFPWEKK